MTEVVENKREILVFGSNLSGVHGAGSAYEAMQNWGAEYGNGVGLQGNSYAIPTKDRNIESMYLEDIYPFVQAFLAFAEHNKHLTFKVVAIGCGLAGFTPEQIAPMFEGYTENVKLPKEFLKVLGAMEPYEEEAFADGVATMRHPSESTDAEDTEYVYSTGTGWKGK